MIFRIAVIFCILIVPSKTRCGDQGKVEHGELDLRTWNSIEHPAVSLDGEWEFYWRNLLLAKDLPGRTDKAFAQLSRPWNEQLIDGERLPRDGYATYALIILLPENMRSISFAVPAVFNSYAFWVNDRLICTSGKVGARASEMEPRWEPQTVTIPSPDDTLQVIFQISNFQHTRGGCSEVMHIGNTAHLTEIDSAFHISGISLIIFFGITGLGGLIVFFIFKSFNFLFLALLSLMYALRFVFSDLYFYNDFGIDVSWEMAAKIEYITIPLIVLCGALFISNIYPQEFNRIILYSFIVTNLLLAGIVIFSTSAMFSSLLVVLQVIGLFFVLYVIYVIIKALIFEREGAWVSVLGLTVFALVGFYNIYAFISVVDMNRVVIHSGYATALLLNIISLIYRTPMRIRAEEHHVLRFSDLYKNR